MGPFSVLLQNARFFKLVPISIRELLFLKEVPCDIYGLTVDDLFTVLLKEKTSIDKELLRDLIIDGQAKLFVMEEDRDTLITCQQNNLINTTRTLSQGEPLVQGKKLLNLLTINLEYLYNNPTDDSYLLLHHQSLKNLCRFLQEHPKIHGQLFTEFQNQNHHFIFAQPLLSSFFLLGLLEQSRLFGQKEIELLFTTSYFKDIGMSAIPTDKYDKENLTDQEKELLAKHPELTVNILSGRIPLPAPYLKIIEQHHTFGLLNSNQNKNQNPNFIHFSDEYNSPLSGFETMIVSIMDIIAAMISGRPYQRKKTLFEALDLVKVLISEQHPHEFKLLVSYFKNFFKPEKKKKIKINKTKKTD